jgi:hypothetical protein
MFNKSIYWIVGLTFVFAMAYVKVLQHQRDNAVSEVTAMTQTLAAYKESEAKALTISNASSKAILAANTHAKTLTKTDKRPVGFFGDTRLNNA